jgi:phosphate transport system permease protein
MTEPAFVASRWSSPAMQAHLKRRHLAERLFRALGLAAIGIALAALLLLLASVVSKGWSAFVTTQLRLDVTLASDLVSLPAEADAVAREQAIRSADWAAPLRQALMQRFPDVTQRPQVRELAALLSSAAPLALADRVARDPSLLGRSVSLWLPADDEVDLVVKGSVPRDLPDGARRLSSEQLGWLSQLETDGRVRRTLNTTFLASGDSREPEQAGILGALVGSFLTLVVTLAIALPLGVAAAIYLEEFAPRNRWTELVEVNINNLAAVPSIVFGLLGLSVFLNFLSLPRSAPLVGGLTLALMTLPTLIIAGRSAIKAVPPGVRDAARGLGASPLQVMGHHVLPLALPGILTGTILGMARALGETAPLLMIGMVAFVVDIPGGFRDAATALPVQIFLWADSPERGFVEKTSGAILVLLAFLIAMNGLAIWLRQRFERQW